MVSSAPNPAIPVPPITMPLISDLKPGLSPIPARLFNTTQPPTFVYLDAGMLAQMKPTFANPAHQKDYVQYMWMSERTSGQPIIFVTTAQEIAVFDNRKEVLKSVKKSLDNSVLTRIGPGMAFVRGFDQMRTSQYLLQTTTMGGPGIHSLIIESCEEDFIRPINEKPNDPRLVVPLSDYPLLDLRLDSFREAKIMLTARHPTAKHQYYFYGVGMSGRSVSYSQSSVLQPIRLGLDAPTLVKSDLQSLLSAVPKPLFSNPMQPVEHTGTTDHRHRYDDMDFSARQWSTDLKCTPLLARPEKMRVTPGTSLMFGPDTNFASRSLRPLHRLVARIEGDVAIASMAEVRRELGDMSKGRGMSPRKSRKVQRDIDYLGGKRGKVRVFGPDDPASPAIKLVPGQAPAVGVLEKDLLIRSQVLRVLETMVAENPEGENVLAIACYDKNNWLLLAAIDPPLGSTLRVIRLKQQDDGPMMEQALYNATSEWLEPVQAALWWIVLHDLEEWASDSKQKVLHAYFWVKEDSSGFVLAGWRKLSNDHWDVLMTWLVGGLLGLLQLLIAWALEQK